MEAKEVIYAILFFAILIEGTVEYVKLAIEKKFYWEVVASFVIGAVATFGYHLDLVEALLGMTPSIPYLGYVVSAIVIARGSNYVFDLIGKFTGAKAEVDSILEGDEARPADEHNEDMVNHEAIEGEG